MRTSQPHPDLHDRLVPAWDAMIGEFNAKSGVAAKLSA